MKVILSEKGFTLIELSIVLVIISLIVAGIVGGQSLIHSAQLRSVVSEVRRFQTAINTYKDYYGYFPGDHPNAEDYWPAECVDTPGNRCNGNGNGKIDNPSGMRERLRMWQHLSLAEMISGNYSGTVSVNIYTSSATNSGTPLYFRFVDGRFEENVFPSSQFNGGYYTGANWTSQNSRNGIVLATKADAGGYFRVNGNLMTAKDAEAIDKKMDDGLPASGSVSGIDLGFFGCSLNSAPDYPYQVDKTDERCRVFFAVE